MDELKNLNFEMLSFMQTMVDDDLRNSKLCRGRVSREDHIKHGQRLLQQQYFLNQIRDSVTKTHDQINESCYNNYQKPQIIELNINMPMSEEEPPIKSMTEDEKIQKGGKPKSKQVLDDGEDSFEEFVKNDLNNDSDEDTETPVKKIDKKNETVPERLQRKFNTMYAEQAKSIGKSLKIKPEKGKKILSKKHVMNRIVKDKKLHQKALKEMKKRNLLNTESTENNSE